mmetsp:Transcript_120788/g.386730  ORF Transcript_120788/g.386730 Transcript_120788/m.386730 type:complete len:89 (-) Transcript_120788:596-862(-)
MQHKPGRGAAIEAEAIEPEASIAKHFSRSPRLKECRAAIEVESSIGKHCSRSLQLQPSRKKKLDRQGIIRNNKRHTQEGSTLRANDNV